MHELPIVEQIIRIATEHGKKARALKIKRIRLVVGERSGYIGESIQMYFDIVSVGTLCEGAALEIEVVKPKLRCPGCGALFERHPIQTSDITARTADSHADRQTERHPIQTSDITARTAGHPADSPTEPMAARPVTPYSHPCPTCGEPGEPTDIGREFYIDHIEVEHPG